MKDRLLKRTSQKYHHRIREFYAEDGLIDGCKYMLVFADGWAWHGYNSVPCKSITEAVNYITQADAE